MFLWKEEEVVWTFFKKIFKNPPLSCACRRMLKWNKEDVKGLKLNGQAQMSRLI